MTLNDFGEDDVFLRSSRRQAEAYRRASSKADAEDEVACLKRAGVILPNGFTTMEPLHLAEGEMLLDIFGRGEALVKMDFPKKNIIIFSRESY